MLKNDQGQTLIEILVVLVVASMMVIALIMIILSSLKNAQFAQNQITATKLAQDTIDKIRILRDNNRSETLKSETGFLECFNRLWEKISSPSVSEFYCGPGPNDYCYYNLNTTSSPYILEKTTPPGQKIAFTDNPGFLRQIKVNQTNLTEVKLIVEISWVDSSGEHSSNLETYLTKPDYDCVYSFL